MKIIHVSVCVVSISFSFTLSPAQKKVKWYVKKSCKGGNLLRVATDKKLLEIY